MRIPVPGVQVDKYLVIEDKFTEFYTGPRWRVGCTWQEDPRFSGVLPAVL